MAPVESEPSAARGASRDGLYLRLGVGLGGSIQTGAIDDETNASVVAGGAVAELAIGHQIARGLILGGGVWASASSWPVYTRRDTSSALDLSEPRDFAVAGLFVDHYLENREGFHLQLGVGLAEVGAYARLRGPGDGDVGIGGGVMLGVGHEGWIHERLGLGVLARITAGLTRELQTSDTWLDTTVPALLITTTYN